MKKTLFLLVFTLLAISSFAQEIEIPNRNIYIEGSASESYHETFFMENFTMEAEALGFNVVTDREDAGYIFRYVALQNEDGYIVLIALLMADDDDEEDDAEIVSFSWPYAEIEEMYEYNQFVFFKAAVLIPGIDEEELRALMAQAGKDVRWRNKFLYVRVSFDFPVTIYQLLPEGLIGGKDAFEGTFGSPSKTTPLGNKVKALPAATIGFELQLLNFLSVEPKIMFGMESLNDRNLLNITAGVEVKVPLKLKNNFMLSPYGAFTYPLFLLGNGKGDSGRTSSGHLTGTNVFASFPRFGVGAGVQFNMKAGKAGAFFIDVNYMFYPGETDIHNSLGEYPQPSIVKYRRSVIGLGVGYKLGFFDRKQQR